MNSSNNHIILNNKKKAMAPGDSLNTRKSGSCAGGLPNIFAWQLSEWGFSSHKYNNVDNNNNNDNNSNNNGNNNNNNNNNNDDNNNNNVNNNDDSFDKVSFTQIIINFDSEADSDFDPDADS